jgi:ATP-dependent Zn protease
LLFAPTDDPPEDFAYSAFITELDAGRVDSVSISPDGEVVGVLADEMTFKTQIPTALDQQNLTQRLAEEDV